MSFWLRRVIGVAAAFVALAYVTPLFAQTGGLTGTVKDERGNALADHPLIIERQEIKGTYKTKTNKKGDYIYIGLPIGNYKVTLQDPSGRPLHFFNTRVGLGDPTQLDFDLAKERAVSQDMQRKQLEENPELKRRMEEQAKDQKELTSLKDLFELGRALYDEKKFVEAADAFEKALPLAKEKNVPIVLAKLGESYHKARQFDKAVGYWQKAIEASPTEAAYRNGLGNVYAEMGRIPEAAEEFKKAAEIDPAQASRYYYNYGVVMYNTGKMEEAAEAFLKATEIDANFADAFFMRGRALMAKLDLDPETGEVKAAPGTEEALEAYLKLEPSGKFAAEAKAMLDTVQGKMQTSFKREKKKKT